MNRYAELGREAALTFTTCNMDFVYFTKKRRSNTVDVLIKT